MDERRQIKEESVAMKHIELYKKQHTYDPVPISRATEYLNRAI